MALLSKYISTKGGFSMYWPQHRMTEGHTEIIDCKLSLIQTLIVQGNEYRSHKQAMQ